MGHIVNPISYRLGASRCWNSVWPNDLSMSFSYTTLMKSDWDLFLFFKRFFDLKIIMQSGYIFSHVKIIREGKKIFCIVYFYDGGSLERSDNMKQILMSKTSQLFSIENMFFISLYSFLRLYQWNSSHVQLLQNFKFSLLFNFFEQKRKFVFFKRQIRSLFFQQLNKIITFFIDFLLILNLNSMLIKDLHYYFCTISVIANNFIEDTNFFLNKLIFFLNSSILLTLITDNSLIQFFSNFCFVFFKFNILNKNFFSFFRKKISDFFLLLRWKMFKKISLISKMLRCGYQFLSFSRYFLHYFADNFFFYFRVKTRLINSLKNMIFFLLKKNTINFSKFNIVLKKLEVSEINAAIMSKYIAIRLRQRFQLKEALMPMLRHLSNNEYVRGFRIVCAGRFTRKEIALYDLRTYSSVPFSGVASRLDFSLSEVVLKYSICGIKVWLHRYCLPEREFGIQAVGMNFMLPPPVHESFSENLKFFEDVREIPFRFESFKKFEKHKKVSKSKFLRFSTRMGPTYDFFFLFFNNISKKKFKKFSNFKDSLF